MCKINNIEVYRELREKVNNVEKFEQFLEEINIMSFNIIDYETYLCRFNNEEGLFILTLEGVPVAGIAIIFGELFIQTIDFYRNRKFMSNFFGKNYIQKFFPDMKTCTCAHSQGTDEYNIVKHILSKSNISLRN